VVNEQLTSHEEEGEVMYRPNKDEEASRIPQARAHGGGEGSIVTALRKEVRTEDADEDGQRDYASPPGDNIADEINLLLILVLGPEGNTGNKEWPVDRSTGVWVGGRQASVVLEHKTLKLAEFPEEIDALRLLLGCIISAPLGGTAVYNIVSGMKDGKVASLTLILDDFINKPDSRALVAVLVSVDLLLFKRPLGK
jgi:hypothetical protein